MPAWWVTRSTLTLSMDDNSGVFILGGNKVYKAFPPKWSGGCGRGYLAPALTSCPTLNANQITNARSLINKVAPHGCTQADIMDSPPIYHNPNSIRTLSPGLGMSHLEETILNISKVTEQGFAATV